MSKSINPTSYPFATPLTETVRQSIPSIDLNAMPSSGAPVKRAPTPGEMAAAREAILKIEAAKRGSGEFVGPLVTDPSEMASLPPGDIMSMERVAPAPVLATLERPGEELVSMERPGEELISMERPPVPFAGPAVSDVTVAGQTIPGTVVDPATAQAFRGGSEVFLDPLGRFTAPPGLDRPPESRFDTARELAEKARRAAFFVSPELKAARVRLDQAEKDLKEIEVDPFGFIKDGKSKLMAILATVLGEASRRTRGKNVATDLLFKFADMETKKGIQKEGKFRTLFNIASQRLGSEITASNMVRDALVKGFQTQLDLELKELEMEDAAAKVASDVQLKLLESQQKRNQEIEDRAYELRKKQLPKYGDLTEARTAAGTQEDTSRALATAVEGIDKMIKGGSSIENELKTLDRGAIDNILDTAARQFVENGGSVASATLSQFSPRIEGAIILRNAVDAIAFGLASQGQSSSAISDNDVLIFKRLLADDRLKTTDIRKFLEHLRMKSEAERFYQRAIEEGNYTPREAEEISRQQMKKVYKVGYDPNVGLMTDFIKDQQKRRAPGEAVFEGMLQ